MGSRSVDVFEQPRITPAVRADEPAAAASPARAGRGGRVIELRATAVHGAGECTDLPPRVSAGLLPDGRVRDRLEVFSPSLRGAKAREGRAAPELVLTPAMPVEVRVRTGFGLSGAQWKNGLEARLWLLEGGRLESAGDDATPVHNTRLMATPRFGKARDRDRNKVQAPRFTGSRISHSRNNRALTQRCWGFRGACAVESRNRKGAVKWPMRPNSWQSFPALQGYLRWKPKACCKSMRRWRSAIVRGFAPATTCHAAMVLRARHRLASP